MDQHSEMGIRSQAKANFSDYPCRDHNTRMCDFQL